MDAQRAKDMVRHIARDEDQGLEAMRKLSAADMVQVVTKILPTCIRQAEENQQDNDKAYFEMVNNTAYLIAVEKLKNIEKRWVVYDDNTGYPYMAGEDMLVLYDYIHRDNVLKPLLERGYKVSLLAEDSMIFTNEIAHMYRNGYHGIRFVDGKGEALRVEREDFYSYEMFFKEEYITNPGMQAAMIRFLQEFRRAGRTDSDEELLIGLEQKMFEQFTNGEFMVPCAKIETEEEIQFVHPPIDLTGEYPPENGEEKVIAIPVFTDGFEMEKCYTGLHENMLYNFRQMKELIEELGASGFVINYLGQKYFVTQRMLKEYNQ